MGSTTPIDRATALMETNVKAYLEIKSAYDECDSEIRDVIDEMIAICASEDARDDQKRRAMHTIIEALFPSLAVDLLEVAGNMRTLPEAKEYEQELDAQEETFADRLKDVLQRKGWTQEQLAERTGVGQPAISNILNRQSRPQSKTVRRFAEALEVSPEELWPNFAAQKDEERD